MKLLLQKTLGALLFIIGISLLASSQSGITGNIISETFGTVGSSIFGLVFIVGGIGIIIFGRGKKEGKLEKKIKDANKRLGEIFDTGKSNPEEMIEIANKLGYDIVDIRGGYRVENKGKKIVIIPKKQSKLYRKTADFLFKYAPKIKYN